LAPEKARLLKRHTDDQEALNLCLRARYFWNRRTQRDIERAIEHYRRAVEKDPGYGLAWAGIAHAVVTSVATIEANRESVRAAAEDALQRALDYGPDLAETQLAFGSYHGFLNRDLPAAEAAQRRAIEIEPTRPTAWVNLVRFSLARGDRQTARSILELARESGISDPRLESLRRQLAGREHRPPAAGDER